MLQTLLNQTAFKDVLYKMDFEYYLNGEKVDLTFTEYKILKILAQREKEVYGSKDISGLLNNELEISTNSSTVRVHIKNIRSKLEKIGLNYIKTINKKGYVLLKLEVL